MFFIFVLSLHVGHSGGEDPRTEGLHHLREASATGAPQGDQTGRVHHHQLLRQPTVQSKLCQGHILRKIILTNPFLFSLVLKSQSEAGIWLFVSSTRMKTSRRWKKRPGRSSLNTGSSLTTWSSTTSCRTPASSCWRQWARRRTSRSGSLPAGYDPTPSRKGRRGGQEGCDPGYHASNHFLSLILQIPHCQSILQLKLHVLGE